VSYACVVHLLCHCRTVIKSLMLVHHMALDLNTDAAARVRKHILRMRKEVGPAEPFLFFVILLMHRAKEISTPTMFFSEHRQRPLRISNC
jgi:hypothetical protein